MAFGMAGLYLDSVIQYFQTELLTIPWAMSISDVITIPIPIPHRFGNIANAKNFPPPINPSLLKN